MDKPNPSKSQEIEILTAAVAQLGDNSYLGPWLKEIIAELQAQIRSDIYPTINLALAQAQASQIVAAASAEASKIILRALHDADKAVQSALSVRAAITDALLKASRDAERVANEIHRIS